jgi:hypothetical protein
VAAPGWLAGDYNDHDAASMVHPYHDLEGTLPKEPLGRWYNMPDGRPGKNKRALGFHTPPVDTCPKAILWHQIDRIFALSIYQGGHSMGPEIG